MKKRTERAKISRKDRPKPPVHVGHLVWRYLNETRQTRTLLANETNRSLITISRQLRKPSMQVAELFEFCQVLKHNFFQTLSASLPAEFTGNTNSTAQLTEQQKTIQQLQTEIAELKAENKKLNDRVDLLLKKL